MKRNDLIAAVVEASGCTKKQVRRVLNGLAETATGNLKQRGDSVTLPGLGRLKVSERKPRQTAGETTGPTDATELGVKFSTVGKLKDALSSKA